MFEVKELQVQKVIKSSGASNGGTDSFRQNLEPQTSNLELQTLSIMHPFPELRRHFLAYDYAMIQVGQCEVHY